MKLSNRDWIPGWECRCDACMTAITHGAPVEKEADAIRVEGREMSDDTKAAVERLRNEVTLTLHKDDPFAVDIVALLADRDALAERCEKLREALWKQVVVPDPMAWGDDLMMCELCGASWDHPGPERHKPDCLAAPKER